MPKFSEIEQFPRAPYAVDIGWDTLERQLERYSVKVDTTYQREYVWTDEQCTAYIEYRLKGGIGGEQIYLNWIDPSDKSKGTEIVDGQQRITAVRKFLNDEIKVFGHYFSEYEDGMRIFECRFRFNIAALEIRQEVYEWYLGLNSGGTYHTKEDLNKVRRLLNRQKIKSNVN